MREKNVRILPFTRLIRVILFLFAAMVWLSELVYLGLARVNSALPISWDIFGIFAIGIQIFFIPALILSFPKDPLNPRRVIVALWIIFTGVFWIFAPAYEYLALYENGRAGILLLITNYIWEIPMVGGLVILPVYRYFLRIIRSQSDSARTRARLTYFPIVSALGMIGFSLFGLVVGLSIARATLLPPPREIIKNSVDVFTLGFLAALLNFFIQGELIRPWIEKLPPPSGE